MKQALLRSSFFSAVEIVIISLISLALTPYLIKHLGEDNYGLWILILSVLGWFTFIDLGFSAAVQRSIVLALEKANDHRVNVIFSVSVVLFSTLGLVAAACVGVIALFPSILGVDQEKEITTTIALGILTFKIFLDFIMCCFHGFFSAYLRQDIDAKLSTLNTIIKSILVFFLILDLNIYGAVIATITADILTNSVKVYFAKRLHPGFKFELRLVKFEEIKELFQFSKHLVLLGIAVSINHRIDPLIISHMLGLKFVGIFNVINSLITQVEQLVDSVVRVFQPVFTKKVAQEADVSQVFKDIISINFFAVLVLFAPLAILAEDFILLWIGPEYIEAGSLAAILGFAYLCRSVSRPINNLLLAKAQHQLLSVINLVGAFTNIGLSLALVGTWGLKGIAFATAVGFFISDVLLHLYLLRRYSDLSIAEPFFQFAKLVAFYVALVMAGEHILSFWPPLSWAQLVLAAVLCFCSSVLIAWPFVLVKTIKTKLISMIPQMR